MEVVWKNQGKFLEMNAWPNWAIRGEGAWWSVLLSSRDHVWKCETLADGQPLLLHAFMFLALKRASHLASLRSVECCSDGWPSVISGAQPSDNQVLGHLSYHGPFLMIAQFEVLALGIVLVLPDIFHLTIMEATVCLITFNPSESFVGPFLTCKKAFPEEWSNGKTAKAGINLD